MIFFPFLFSAAALATPMSLSKSAKSLKAAAAPAPEDQGQITINQVSTSGTGCPGDTVSVSISLDRTVVTLGFDAFQTNIGDSFARADSDKDCEIHLNVHYPGGYTYAVMETTYHGFAQLDDGVTSTFESEYVFADTSGVGLNRMAAARTTTKISGGGIWEEGEVFTQSDDVPADRQVKSPCGQNVNLLIRTRIDLTGNGEGAISDEDATISFTEQVNLTWEKCQDE